MPSWPMRCSPVGPSGQRRYWSDVVGDAARPAGGRQRVRRAGCLRRRLEHHRVARGEGREHTARGNGEREVPRRHDGDHPERPERSRVTHQVRDPLGVVAGEVDRLGHLGVTLTDGLARLRGHRCHQLRPPARQLVGDAVEDRRRCADGPDACQPSAPCRAAATTASTSPGSSVSGGEVDRGRIGQRGDDPGPGLGVGRVAVGLVAEPRAGDRDGPATAGGDRHDPPVSDGLLEAGLLDGQLLGIPCEVEEVAEEVLAAAVLLETAEQVGEGGVEVGGVDDRRVEQQVDRWRRGRRGPRRAPCPGASRCSTRPVTPRVSASSVAQATSKRLWLATPMRTAVDPVGLEGPVEHALVVRVGLRLGRRRAPGSIRAWLGVDPLHRQVGALDEADLDPRSPGGSPLVGPGRQVGGARRKSRAGRPAGRSRPRRRAELRLVEEPA